MQCTKCGADNPAAKKFCGDCGAALDADVRNANGGEIPPSITGAAGYSAWLRKVYALGNAFTERLELDELIPFVLARCRELLNAEGVAVLLIDEEHNQLYFPYVSEDDPEVAKRLTGLRFPADRGIAGAVLRSGHAEKVDDVRSDPRFFSGVDQKTGMASGSIIAAPLIAAPLITDEGSLGVLEAVNRRGGGPFSDSRPGPFRGAGRQCRGGRPQRPSLWPDESFAATAARSGGQPAARACQPRSVRRGDRGKPGDGRGFPANGERCRFVDSGCD
jgi:hypothetical protein